MEMVAVVTVLALLEYAVFSLLVGMARERSPANDAGAITWVNSRTPRS